MEGAAMSKLNKTIVLAIIFSFFGLYSFAGADPWKNSLDMSLNLTQNAYSNSWTGGEIGNMVWVGIMNGIFEKQASSKFNFRNTTKLQFGETISQDQTTKDWHHPVKSTDKIEIDNMVRLTVHAFVDPYIDLGLLSQFYDATYKPKKSYLNPLLITESAGAAKTLYSREKNEVITRLGFSFRQNILVDTTTASLPHRSANDGGFESVTETHYALAKTLSYSSKLTLFKAIFFSDKTKYKGLPEENYWKAIHVNFENTLAASVTKYVQVTLYTQLLYDKLISTKGRFKETLALGLTFKLK
jgi:hypothetical protein